MPVPRNRTSNARKNSRRSHHAQKKQSFATCQNCSSKYQSHHICQSCGNYDGRNIIKKTEVEEVE